MKKCVLCLFFLLQTAYSATYGQPGCFAFSGEWLFFQASIDQPFFVINSRSNLVTNGERFSNDQQWHHGYRLEALYRFGNCLSDLTVRWTHIPRFTDQKTISGTNLFGVFTSPQASLAGARGEAKIRDDFNFFMLDMLLGQTLFDFRNFRFGFQGGAQYGYASLYEEVIFNTNQVGGVRPRIVRNRSKISGAGPEIGVNFAFRILRWLDLVGRASGSLLVAERKTSLFDNGTLAGSIRIATEIKNSPYWAVIPTSNARLGLTFRNPCDLRRWFECSPLAALGCLNFDLEIGYEVICFYKTFSRIFFVDDTNPGTSTDEIMDLTFHGPYVHLGLSF